MYVGNVPEGGFRVGNEPYCYCGTKICKKCGQRYTPKCDHEKATFHDHLPERLSKITEENLRGALARGYCTDRNKHKTLDSDLLDDCFNAVWEYLIKKGVGHERFNRT